MKSIYFVRVHNILIGVGRLLQIYGNLKHGDGKVSSYDLLDAIDVINRQATALLKDFESIDSSVNPLPR